MHPDNMIPQNDDVNQDEIDTVERNMLPCPFCLGKPFFEESDNSWFVACECGVRMPGESAHDGASKWNTRILVPKSLYRTGPREYGTWR